jgi:D-amino peptidase
MPKVYIAVDMEGLAGVVNQGQLFPGSLDYPHFREIMTGEALAAVEGARAGGATEIVVADCHLNADNLVIDNFPGDVRVIRGWPRPQFHLAGLDSSFQAVALIGFHAPGHSLSGVRAHTFTSAHFTHVSLNGMRVSETVFNAAVAGHHGVPIVMISGDDVAIADARAMLGEIEAVETKQALGFHSAASLTPVAARARIAEAVQRALGRIGDFRAYVITTPITVEVGFQSYRPTELLGYLRGIERSDARTIRYQVRDMVEAADFLMFLTSFEPSLKP